jgi:hypothetical protein
VCQLIDDSGTQNEADDNINIIDVAEEAEPPVIISPPPRKRAQPKKAQVHFKGNMVNKSLDDLVDDFDKCLEEESAHDLCYSEKGVGSCTCLHILRKPHPRRLVSKYLAAMAIKSKTDKDCKETVILEWYKYAVANQPYRNGRNMYLFPFDASDVVVDETDGDDPLGVNELLGKEMCQQGLFRVMGITKIGFQRIREAATTGVLKPHGLIGKDGNNLMDPEVCTALEDHFDELCSLGEVRATRVMAALVDGGRVLTNRGNDADADKNIYLPTSDGYRTCYRRFMLERGYKTTTADDGKITHTWIGKLDEEGRRVVDVPIADRPKIVCMSTYMNMWKRKYPHLKVSRPVEDTCGECYRFAMRHKYLAMHRNMSNVLPGLDDTTITADDHDSVNAGNTSRETPMDVANSLFRSSTYDQSDNGEGDGNDSGSSDDKEEDVTDNNNIVIDIVGHVMSELEDLIENPDAAATDPNDEAVERAMIRSALHVYASRIQRKLYQEAAKRAREDAEANTPHPVRVRTYVVDFGQNMEMPVFNREQAGCTYYFSPLTVNNCGVVDHGHKYPDGTVSEHMHAHVYTKDIGKKGSNNVVSLMDKTFTIQNILREDECGGELNVFFDNCTGQNKNNTVLKYMVWLVEMGYFKKVNFIFLIIGHTKNAADRLFNALKFDYRKHDIYTVEDLLVKLDKSDSVSIQESTEDDFFDYTTYLDGYYKHFSGLVLSNHIFSCENERVGNKLIVNIRESGLEQHPVKKFNVMKNSFPERKNYQNLKEAIDNRRIDMRGSYQERLVKLIPPGMNAYKHIELWKNYRPQVPPTLWDNRLYRKPPQWVFDFVKSEKGDRKSLRENLRGKRASILDSIETIARGGV